MKEYRVYVNDLESVNVDQAKIQSWNDLPELDDDAQEFITTAENEGCIYTLNGFQLAFNNENISDVNDIIFITNKW